MKNCPVCGAPVADDVPECFKCGSNMRSRSGGTPSLMARFKQEAELKPVRELDEDEPQEGSGDDRNLIEPRRLKTHSRAGGRAPDPLGGGQPRSPPVPPPRKTTGPPRTPLTPRRPSGSDGLERPEPAVPTELSALMGSPTQELAQASRIYAELLARGGMGPKILDRLDRVMSEMGADTELLKAKFASGEAVTETDPETSPARGQRSARPGPGPAPARTKAPIKGKTTARSRTASGESTLPELPAGTSEVPKGGDKGPTKAPAPAGAGTQTAGKRQVPGKTASKPKAANKGKDMSKGATKGAGKGKGKGTSKGATKGTGKATVKGKGAPGPSVQARAATDTESSEELATSHCPLCGKEAETDWTHCPWCGGELPPHCPACQREMAPDWRFCPYCGFDDRA